MEKGRGSRLKRKVVSKAKKEDQDVTEISSNNQLKHLEKVQPIVLSSDSDGECDPSRPKQRNVSNGGESTTLLTSVSKKSSGISEGNTSNLQKLKKLLCSLSSQEKVDISSIKPLPPHIQGGHERKETCGHNKGSLLLTSEYKSTEELSAFPKPCKTCIKLNRGPDKAKNNEFENVLPNSEDTHIESGHDNNKSASINNEKNISETGNDTLGHSDAINNQASCDINVRKSPSTNNRAGIVIRSECEVNNSHLMRDRNANLYSLQSRNHTRHLQTNDSHTRKMTTHPTSSTNPHLTCAKQTTSGSTSNKTCTDRVNHSNVSNSLTLKQGNDAKHTLFNEKKSQQVKTSANMNCDGRTEQGRQHSQGPSLQRDLSPLDDLNQKQVNLRDQSIVSGAQPVTSKVMQSCPMCQIQFSTGASQLDIDGHLAACLSSAGEDINW